MSVVNVKVKHIRPRYANLREWCTDPNNVYIARRGIVFIDGKRFPPEDSPFANPFRIPRDGNRAEVIEKYRAHITEKLKDPAFAAELETLRHKNLGCWCAPEPCHGHVLLELISQK